MDEPQWLGTVVEAQPRDWDDRYVLTRCRSFGEMGSWMLDATGHRFYWGELRDPVILHGGYVPPVPEPKGWGAAVRDAGGCVFSRTGDEPDYPWLDRMYAACKWSALKQPVEVAFEGFVE